MGTGWRRAFCTTVPRDREQQKQHQQSSQNQSPSTPRICAKLGFLSGGSNPSTPRLQSQSQSQSQSVSSTTQSQSQSQSVSSTTPTLRCRTSSVQTSSAGENLISPNLHCKTTTSTPKSTTKSPRTFLGSNPSSPRSPFSIFRNSLRLTKNNCGICSQSMKTGQRMAIYTAECSHAFHFPCIAAHVRKQSTLVCPVCKSAWRDVPLLAIHKSEQPPQAQEDEPKTTTCNSQEENKEKPTLANIKIKAYDDDEPLLSPTAGGRFVPIPEADENEEAETVPEEIEEFQGFFVNPIPSSTSRDEYCSINGGRDFQNVEVKVMPEVAVVSAGKTHESYAVVLKLKAPPPPPATPPAHNSSTAHFLDPSCRAPIDLVTVLDVSGSMSGAKLQMLKRAMRLVISSLGSSDRLSIVAFSACPKRLLPLKRMTVQGQRAARRIIDRLGCSQGTSVGDALRKATKVLEDRRERNPVASIMLLSDGQDERVQTSHPNQRGDRSHVSSTRFAHIEIPVHTFGFGQKASSNYSREPVEDAFAKCVGGLLSVVVQDFRLQLGIGSGSDPAEITAVYSCNGRPTVLSSGSFRLGDLYAEEERELLVELRVPSSAIGGHHVLSVRCNYKDPATQEVINGRDQSLLVPLPQGVRSTSPKIERLRNLFITTRAIAEARRLIEHNEVSSAHRLLSSARALLMQSNSITADEYVRGLEAELAGLEWRLQYQHQMEQQMIQRRRVNEREMAFVDENGEPLTPTSAWRAAERLAKMAMMKKSLNRVSDLHGFENARF
ncbi:E3 ubiquitin-protein ligase WAV3 [Cornus florida]|uniref:E3 ubiquitin-protein ligase WAV3 n=1 Tax=Cornus florida TaxID=4283 RepID=UPI0028A122DE|nr:E3 ubiquitin-protein ligase WAV3 [Cornus florida]